MFNLNPYVRFNGNCKEAMNFYKDCLGGELTIQLVKDSPMAAQMQGLEDKILHATLISDGVTLMGSDLIEGARNPGNVYTLCIHAGSFEELNKIFVKFSVGGKVTHQLEEMFFGTYGDLTDKFGVSWMFQSDPKKS